MSALSAHVPTLDLCREMAAIPAFVEPFRESALVWLDDGEHGIGLTERESVDEDIPAPLCDEMLAWLKPELERQPSRGYYDDTWAVEDRRGAVLDVTTFTDPDALARACIEAAK